MRDYGAYGNLKLENLTLGYRGDANSGLCKNDSQVDNQNVYMYLDDIKVYTFDPNVSSLKVVKSALMVPEPTTATLSLLALAGLAVRRRRK